MISYDRFWATIKKKGISTYVLREKYKVSPSVMTKLKNDKYVSIRTIEDLCRILDCQIEDIVQYIPDLEEKSN